MVVVIDGIEEGDLQILVLWLRAGVASTSVRAIWKLCPLLELINTGDCALELFVAFGAAPCREDLFFSGCFSSLRGTSSTPGREVSPALLQVV